MEMLTRLVVCEYKCDAEWVCNSLPYSIKTPVAYIYLLIWNMFDYEFKERYELISCFHSVLLCYYFSKMFCNEGIIMNSCLSCYIFMKDSSLLTKFQIFTAVNWISGLSCHV